MGANWEQRYAHTTELNHTGTALNDTSPTCGFYISVGHRLIRTALAEALPDWQKETDADIFERVESEPSIGPVDTPLPAMKLLVERP